MLQQTAKSDCLGGKNVILWTVAYGDNFHITVTERACVNATAQSQENSSGKWGCPVILWRMKIYLSIFFSRERMSRHTLCWQLCTFSALFLPT